MKKIIVLFLIVRGILLIDDCMCQWEPDVRLTNNAAESHITYSAKCMASNGNVVHIVWFDSRDGNREIYYKRSTDGGSNWEADTRLTNDNAVSWHPSLSLSGQVLHIVWSDYRDGNYEIYYKRSTDGGTNWGADTRLTNAAASSGYPSIAVSGQVVHVVWRDVRDGNNEIYYKSSTDGGSSWGADIRLTNDTASSVYPNLSISGQVVHVVWSDYRDGDYEIYYKRSTDVGMNWGPDTRLTNVPSFSEDAAVAVSGSVVHVVWSDTRDVNPEIYYKRSTDGGSSWGADVRLTNNPAWSFYSSVAVSGSIVHVVWEDYRDGNHEIYYKCSTDGGSSWGVDTRLTNNVGASYYPKVSVTGSAVHVAWEDNRDGNFEIYCKCDPTGNIAGFLSNNSEIPKEFSLNQNYPNPFNPTTKIEFSLPKNSFTKLVIYDLLGREIETLVNEQLNAGTYEVNWNADKFSSGVYFYRIKTEGFSDVRRMILIK